MFPFTKLAIWKRSEDLAVTVYALTRHFPSEEKYTLVSQLRRAAISVPTNIAEGSSRRHPTDFARFLNISEGSLAELQSLLRISCRLEYVATDALQPLLREAEELSSMVHVFRRKVEAQRTEAEQTP